MSNIIKSIIMREADSSKPALLQEFSQRFFHEPSHVVEIGGQKEYVEVDEFLEDLDYDQPDRGAEVSKQEKDEFIKFLEEKKLNKNVVIKTYSSYYNNYFSNLYIFTDRNIIVNLDVSVMITGSRLHYTLMGDHDDETFKDLLEFGKRYIKEPSKGKNCIYLITQNTHGFQLTDIDLSKKLHDFSHDHYNDDFVTVSERIKKEVQVANESGLVLLHGDTGTGKTSYLKNLIHTISGKKVIYLPPDLTGELSSPGFMTFLMKAARNSVLLIEDAENVLRAREAGGNQAVSNILNLSNGIIGDVLNLQIICTFNCPLIEVDHALLRPGRLIAEYRFEKLTKKKTHDLLVKLYGEDYRKTTKDGKPLPERLSLAEIFNHDNLPEKTAVVEKKFGFT